MLNNRIGYLHFWCQKVLPLVYDNSLSYLEVLYKVKEKLNEVIKFTNDIPEYIDKKVIEAFDEEHLKELISEVFKTIEDAISANNEGTNTHFSTSYPDAGTLVWHDNKLYKTKHPIDAGDTILPDSNIELVNFGDMFNEFLTEVKTRFTDNDDGDRETSSTDRPVHDLVWLHNELYEVIKPIAEGNAYIYTGANKNVESTNLDKIYDYLLDLISSEIDAREHADDVLDGKISYEATAREDADTALGGRINDEILAREGADTALGGRIDGEILAREGADNTLQGNIDTETRARVEAILEEYNARVEADNAINARIDNLSGYKDGFKNIKDYGAVGDGGLHPLSEFYNSLDAARVDFPFAQSLTLSIDAAALQKAINNNLLVFVPKGIYIFNGSVVLPQNASITIQGEDKQHTAFKSVISSISMIHFERVSGASLFTIKDIQFVCETGVTGVTAIYFHGLIDGATRYEDNWITVQRCNFYDLNRALDLYTCSNIYVDHCYAVRTTIFAHLGRAASFAHFSNILTLLGWCTIYCEDALEDGISNGLYCYDVIGVFNSNLTFRVHGWQAVYIQNCSADFQGGVDGGYFIYGCQDVTINGCWCAGTDVANSLGIRLWNCYNAHISDCTIEHFTSGLRIDAPAYCGNTISNNVFLANSGGDIGVHAGSGVIITGNTFRSGSVPILGYENTSHNIADNNVMIGTVYPMQLGDGSLVDRNVYI